VRCRAGKAASAAEASRKTPTVVELVIRQPCEAVQSRQIPRSVSSCARQNRAARVQGAAAMARIQPQQLLRRGRGDQRRGVVRQRRSGTVTAMIWTPLNKAVVAVDAVSFTPLQDLLQSVLATLSDERPAWSAAGRADRRPAPQPRGDRPGLWGDPRADPAD
jgi:hypothetical protein